MGMLDSLDGVLNTYAEITEAAKTLGEHIDAYGKIDSGAMRAQSINKISNTQSVALVQANKPESAIPGDVNDSVTNESFQSYLLQALTKGILGGLNSIAPSDSLALTPVDPMSIYEDYMAAESSLVSGIVDYAASTVQPPKYAIQITTGNKTQTITTLNDPADFLAALTEL